MAAACAARQADCSACNLSPTAAALPSAGIGTHAAAAEMPLPLPPFPNPSLPSLQEFSIYPYS
eukprot:scaffold10326_cov31-Tisochrysis_lutea.AAC.8